MSEPDNVAVSNHIVNLALTLYVLNDFALFIDDGNVLRVGEVKIGNFSQMPSQNVKIKMRSEAFRILLMFSIFLG
jgi:hypothetical protein